MTCQERKDLLLLFISGALDPAEEADLRAHLAQGCPQCAGALAEAEATFHQIPLSLAPQPAPAGAWEKIETRIALKEQMEPHGSQSPDRTVLAAPFTPNKKSWSARAGWSIAAVLALALGLHIFHAMDHSHAQAAQIASLNDQLEHAAAFEQKLITLQIEFDQLKKQNDRDRIQLVSLQDDLDLLRRADVMPITSAEQPDAQGRLFWDKSGNTMKLFIAKARQTQPGKVYQLWLIPQTGNPIPMEGVPVDNSGNLILSAKIPEGAGPLKGAAVTLENAPSSPTPTMPLQFTALQP